MKAFLILGKDIEGNEFTGKDKDVESVSFEVSEDVKKTEAIMTNEGGLLRYNGMFVVVMVVYLMML